MNLRMPLPEKTSRIKFPENDKPIMRHKYQKEENAERTGRKIHERGINNNQKDTITDTNKANSPKKKHLHEVI